MNKCTNFGGLLARPLAALATCACLLGISAGPLGAQQARVAWPETTLDPRLTGAHPLPVQAPPPEEGGYLGIAKWSALAVSAGASLYGFRVNSQADDTFREIQEVCDADPIRCQNRNPDGSFADPDLEARYQKVLDKDRSARAALILAQAGLAASVILFVLDLDGSEPPPDIPFDPPRVSFSPERAEVSYRVALPFH